MSQLSQPERSAEAPPLFAERHLGSAAPAIEALLKTVGYSSVDALLAATIPAEIRHRQPLRLPAGTTEAAALAELAALFARNELRRSYIGMGYTGCHTPPVIQRNILENPGWYTAYTPYQAEISQGRLEALLNYQTLITDLTGLAVANASLLDEATAAAEAMALCHRVHTGAHDNVFLVSTACHPQTIAVVQARAEPLGIKIVVDDHRQFKFTGSVFGVLIQYPATDGAIFDYADLCTEAHRHSALVVCAADLLALTLLKPPGEFGADIAIGTTQRFGVPLGYGGPHAAYFATRDAYKRQMPGRLIGLSRDAQGRPALRMALQTREQHIRREKATSNICTAQVLLAVIAGMYAVWHGPAGLRRIAQRIHDLTRTLAARVDRVGTQPFFDTLRIRAAAPADINVRDFGDGTIGVTLDETTTDQDVDELIQRLGRTGGAAVSGIDALARTSPYLTAPVFNRYHTEHELLRYLHRLESRDLSLTTSMIPLGSCTMKLNATAEMLPVTWPAVGQLHPFAPAAQAAGYHEMLRQLESWLCEITGFAACSLQPNAGSAGEYAGLLAIRAFHRSRNEPHRTVCLIPVSAHGTNPASAAMAGLRVVPVACQPAGDIDLADLRAKAAQYQQELAALMVTYPSTHGVFEPGITEVCRVIHDHGGQVYLDGANMNAMVGLCRPGDFGADVCHLNLHKTFCIPHGGGGPGVGPICVAQHLAPFLPGTPPLQHATTPSRPGPVSAAPYGSASILVIPWMYIRLMGGAGLTAASQLAILNANYIARRLAPYFPTVYRGHNGTVAHECIVDVRDWKHRAGIEVEDIAKRLMDYGFHAPTMSWPVAGTLMIEPTESESKEELDRFCDALVAIHGELLAIESGAWPRDNNPLKNAPHTAAVVCADKWDRPYSREQAAYPAPWLRDHKFWPTVGRVDNVHGDRYLVCTCPAVTDYA